MNDFECIHAELARLREELKSALALASQDHASMLAALGESMRLREVNTGLLALLREWRDTEIDTMDGEFDLWMTAFTARVDAALSAAAQEQTPSPRGDPESGMAAQPASAADHEPEAV